MMMEDPEDEDEKYQTLQEIMKEKNKYEDI
jgi:hypothetical protein